MKKLNITPQEVVKNFAEKKLVDGAFLAEVTTKLQSITVIPSKKFVTPKLILPGMFEYSDDLIYPELIPENQLRGVIGSVNKSEVLIWCLKSKKDIKWSYDYWYAGTQDLKLRGWEATPIILETAKKYCKSAPAAEYSANYVEDGVEKGSAFLFSYVDAKLLFLNIDAFEATFNQLGITFERYLWSSTEGDGCFAWLFCSGGSGGRGYFCNEKNHCLELTARPVRRREL